MLEGKCPKCGRCFMGWALLTPRHQTCPRCGMGLEITDGGRKILTGYSPFSAERYLINPPRDVAASGDKKKEDRGGKSGD